MASPFPGMDPYLEGEMWQEFHTTLASEISTQLLRTMPQAYVALLDRRCVLDRESFSMPERVPQISVAVRDIAQRRLVTAIEILSPVNKLGDGVPEYAGRRTAILETQTHLLEIDLIRRGAHVRLVGTPSPAPYNVYLSRAQRRPMTAVWPVGLRERLPAVPVPLLPPDGDVALDLQAAVDACFELVGYERLLDYSEAPPRPPLAADDAAWLDAVLREAGYRA